jgi:hypothetical protein
MQHGAKVLPGDFADQPQLLSAFNTNAPLPLLEMPSCSEFRPLKRQTELAPTELWLAHP